jgi:hypothetical protein
MAHCLHLQIDYEKLAGYAGMSNPRSASNAWAKIKLKLMTPAPDGAVPTTPKKTPRKKTASAKQNDGEEGADTATPKKTPRKRVAKKQDVDGDSSPKKKATPRTKKNLSDASEYTSSHDPIRFNVNTP